MWEQTLEVARYATAWGRPMSEVRAMTGYEIDAMDQAHREMWRKARKP